MDGLVKVMQRITAIEQRFGVSANNYGGYSKESFANTLQQAKEAQNHADIRPERVAKVYDASEQEVVKMLQFSAKQHGVDPKLAIAVAKNESSFSPNALSSAGAIGVMQLMPDTARGLGVKDPYDPRQNIDGGVRYLKQLLESFGGNVEKTVAAYNAGPQAVNSYGGIPPYAETQNYVRKVMADYR